MQPTPPTDPATAECIRTLAATNRRLWIALALAPWIPIAALFWILMDVRREAAASEAERRKDHEVLEQYNSVDAFRRLDRVIEIEEARAAAMRGG